MHTSVHFLSHFKPRSLRTARFLFDILNVYGKKDFFMDESKA